VFAPLAVESGLDLPCQAKGAAMTLPTTMKATVLMAPHRFEVQDRPVPTPGDEDVLLRVRACGI
jgi:hypothetical protein